MKTISQRENITDICYAKVIDYIENNIDSNINIEDCNMNFHYMFKYWPNSKFSIWLTKNEKIAIYNNDDYHTIIELNKLIFAENIEWLFLSISKYSIKRNLYC